MFLSAVSVLVVAQSSSEIPEGLMNNPVYVGMRWMGHVARMRYRKGVYRVLVGKTDGKRPLGRTKYR